MLRVVEIAGSTALVTGAARGIGRAVARRLADEGACVVVVDVAAGEGNRTVQEVVAAGGRASFVAADVTDENDVKRMLAHAERVFGGLEIVVNNAGGYEQPASSPRDRCYARSREEVDAFHRAGVAAGFRSNGAPEYRAYDAGYYAAYLLDPDDNNVEALYRDVGNIGHDAGATLT